MAQGKKKATRKRAAGKAPARHKPGDESWWDLFFAELAETKSVEIAAKIAGQITKTVWNLRTTNPRFKERWKEAWNSLIRDLESSAMARAIGGWDEPVFYKGEQCGTKRVYNPALTIFMLKANLPDRYHLERHVADASAEEQARMLRHFLVATAPKRPVARSESIEESDT